MSDENFSPDFHSLYPFIYLPISNSYPNWDVPLKSMYLISRQIMFYGIYPIHSQSLLSITNAYWNPRFKNNHRE